MLWPVQTDRTERFKAKNGKTYQAIREDRYPEGLTLIVGLLVRQDKTIGIRPTFFVAEDVEIIQA